MGQGLQQLQLPPVGDNAEECLQFMWGSNIKISLAFFNWILMWKQGHKCFLILAKPFRNNPRSGIPFTMSSPPSYPWNSRIQLASTAFQNKRLVFLRGTSGKMEENLWGLVLQMLQSVWWRSKLDEALQCNQKAGHK